MKKLLNFEYYTPDIKALRAIGHRKVAVMLFGQWEELYPYEVLLAHRSHKRDLSMMKLIPAKKPTVYKTIKEAKTNKSKMFKMKTTE